MNGFTLVEVLVAMVILQVGLMGVAGLTVLSATNLGAAAQMETMAAVAEEVIDSLASLPNPADGSRSTRAGRLEWRVAAVSNDGLLRIALSGTDAGGRRILVLRGILPIRAAGGVGTTGSTASGAP